MARFRAIRTLRRRAARLGWSLWPQACHDTVFPLASTPATARRRSLRYRVRRIDLEHPINRFLFQRGNARNITHPLHQTLGFLGIIQDIDVVSLIPIGAEIVIAADPALVIPAPTGITARVLYALQFVRADVIVMQAGIVPACEADLVNRIPREPRSVSIFAIGMG